LFADFLTFPPFGENLGKIVAKNACIYIELRLITNRAIYFSMLNSAEDWAIEETEKRLERLMKRDLIVHFRNVLVTLVTFFDIKAAHDCLASIIEKLDERVAIMKSMYGSLAGVKSEDDVELLIKNMPQRAWIE